VAPGTAEHSPGSRLGASQGWLQQLGFTDNPFALRQAGLEKRLEEYFVEPPGFELARGPHSVFLFAPHGGGKTACRIIIERACRPYDAQSDVLAVPYYTALETLATEVGPDWLQTGRDRHIEALLRQTLYALYADLVSHDEVSVYTDQVALLRGLIDRYALDVLAPQNVISHLRQAGALRGDLPDLDRVLEAFGKRQLREALGDRLVTESKSGRILVSLVDSRALPATELPLDALARVARTFGIHSVFVLVDGLE
jgi:hypothetical protein